MDNFNRWLGHAFEPMCRHYYFIIARLLDFGRVSYQAGPFYNRNATKADPGYQLDLVFDRTDHVITLCEIKYTQHKTGTSVIDEFEKKLQHFPNKKNKTLHKVLITQAGADDALHNAAYVDDILVLEDLFQPFVWHS